MLANRKAKLNGAPSAEDDLARWTRSLQLIAKVLEIPAIQQCADLPAERRRVDDDQDIEVRHATARHGMGSG